MSRPTAESDLRFRLDQMPHQKLAVPFADPLLDEAARINLAIGDLVTLKGQTSFLTPREEFTRLNLTTDRGEAIATILNARRTNELPYPVSARMFTHALEGTLHDHSKTHVVVGVRAVDTQGEPMELRMTSDANVIRKPGVIDTMAKLLEYFPYSPIPSKETDRTFADRTIAELVAIRRALSQPNQPVKTLRALEVQLFNERVVPLITQSAENPLQIGLITRIMRDGIERTIKVTSLHTPKMFFDFLLPQQYSYVSPEEANKFQEFVDTYPKIYKATYNTTKTR